MNIPFKVNLLTETAREPKKENEEDLWDLFADNFECVGGTSTEDFAIIKPQGRTLVGTGIALRLPVRRTIDDWCFFYDSDRLDFEKNYGANKIQAYAVADIIPYSRLVLKHGITVLSSHTIIDKRYREEIGVILYNAGHEPYTINRGDKIAQMIIRPFYPSSLERF